MKNHTAVSIAIPKNLTSKAMKLSLLGAFLIAVSATCSSGQNPKLTQMPLSELEELCSKGDGSAMVQLALRYNYGPDLPFDLAKTHEWFEKAAAKGNPAANGLCTLNGWGRKQDKVLGFKLLGKTVTETNDAVAIRALGRCFAYGWGCEADPKRAFGLWEKALAENEDAAAFHTLAMGYFEGTGCEKSPAKGVEFLEKAAAKGSGFSMNTLGEYFARGTSGVEKDPSKSESCFLWAAKLGYPDALANLLNMHSEAADALEHGQPKNPEGAKQLLSKAIVQGRSLLQAHQESIGLRFKLAELIVKVGRGTAPSSLSNACLEAVNLCAASVNDSSSIVSDTDLGHYFNWIVELTREPSPLGGAKLRALLVDGSKLESRCNGPESKLALCHMLLGLVDLSISGDRLEDAKTGCNKIIEIACGPLEKDPWDWYLRDKLAGACMKLGDIKQKLNDPDGEIRAMQMWFRLWGNAVKASRGQFHS